MPLTLKEEKAIAALLDAICEWPCEPMGNERGGKHYEVDYTVAKARKTYRAFVQALDAFPQFEARNEFRRYQE